MKKITTLFNPIDIYKPFYLDYNTPTQVYFGSANSGKSYFIAQKIVEMMVRRPKVHILAIRKVKDTCRVSVYAVLKDVIESIPHLKSLTKFTANPLSIQMVNGSKVDFFGMDDADKLKSVSRAECVWLEEADQCSSEDFDLLRTRLRGPYEKQMLISFNPTAKTSWLYSRFFSKGDHVVYHSGKLKQSFIKEEALTELNVGYHSLDKFSYNGTVVLKTTYRDNPYVGKDIELLLEGLKDTNKLKYQVYSLGNFGVIESEDSILTTKDLELSYVNDIDEVGQLSIGLDPAAKGEDSTVISIARGNCLLEIKELRTDDVYTIARELILLIIKYKRLPQEFISVKLDSTGLGAYLPKILKRLLNEQFPNCRIEIHGINFASKAINFLVYNSIISEIYFNLVNRIKHLRLIQNDELEEELITRTFEYDDKMRLKIKPKKLFKLILGRSPDTADSVALCFYEPRMIKQDLKKQHIRRDVKLGSAF